MSKFYTQYNRPDEDFEELSDMLIVERAGYIDTKTQIENFIRSGQLLMASRRSMYDDFGEEDDDAPLPPDRYINDPVDIAEQQRINAAYKQAKEEAKEEAQEEAQKKAQKESQKEPQKEPQKEVETASTEKTENSN